VEEGQRESGVKRKRPDGTGEKASEKKAGKINWWHRRGYLVVSGAVDWWGSRLEKCVLHIFLFLVWGMICFVLF
jgi:hypothetical protein